MPGDEYASTGGGSLKLKGVGSSSKITKKKKKRPKSPPAEDTAERTRQLSKSEGHPVEEGQVESDALAHAESGAPTEVEDETTLRNRGKTEAEIRHEERRRRRLDERLKREGTKTHKERVEELNRYLSNLSEHHDMPRIGPG